MPGGFSGTRAEAWRGRAVAAASALAAALFGAAVVLAAFGPGILDPHAVGWMLAGPLGPDPVQYWLGWTYFVRSPWSLPPGLNPDYGMEIGSAIFFADAVPLLALVLKALRGVVEVPQYFGAWLLGCGVLQGLAAWWLLGLATRNPWARAAGAALFVLQPMLLNRMGGHFGLAGQWTILAALWLCLRRRCGGPQTVAWALLLSVTSLVHSYLLVMVLALWLADFLSRARDGARPRLLALEILVVPGAVALCLWAAGFFVLGSGHVAPGYGSLGLDLLAPFDGGQWSSLLPDLPDLGHDESGGSYLGLGGLLLLAAAALAWAASPVRRLRPALRRHWPLIAMLLGLVAFAVTHHATIGGLQVVLFQPPSWMLDLAGTLRASERFFWPLGYAALFAAIWILARAWGGRRTALLLTALVVVQAIDLRDGLRTLHSYVAGAPREVPVRLPDPFWEEAAQAYRRIRAVPAASMGLGWESIARLAATHGLPTDSIYLARVDTEAVQALREKTAGTLASGHYEPGTLYVLRDAAMRDLARRSHDPARDLLAEVDGYTVLAPGWFPGHAMPAGARRIGAE